MAASQDDLDSLADGARSDDRPSLETLLATHVPALMAFLRTRVDGVVAARESVRDLAQSVCREALQESDRLDWRGEAAFRSWLFVLATRKLLDRRRYYTQQRRDQRVEVPVGDDAELLLNAYAQVATPSRNASAREELGRVERDILALPEAQREALLLSRVAGLSYAEIARQKGCNESAVRGLVARALTRLALSSGDA